MTIFSQVRKVFSVLVLLSVFFVSAPRAYAASTILINNLQPDWTTGGGVYSAYYGPDNGHVAVSPGSTALFDGREAGIIKAGQGVEPGSADWDEGLFGFAPTITIDDLVSGTLTYDVESAAGINPVWMTIEIDTGVIDDRSDNTVYQFVPTSNPAGWHTVDAGAGLWQKWNDSMGDVTGNPLVSLSDVATAHTGLNVVRVYLRLGMGSSYYNGGTGTTAWVDKVTISGVTYDFVVPTPPADCNGSSFDAFTVGSINTQGGWGVTGSYDQAIVDNTYGYSSFGCKSFRLSNAVTSGAFGDQTFSPSNADEAGEIDSTNGGMSGGTRQNRFVAEFSFASTQSTQQPGLFVSVSPDRGDGSRMSYLGLDDQPGGIDVIFYDTPGTSNPASFSPTIIATSLARTSAHTAKFVIDFIDGPSNDVVKIYIDGVLVHTGTTWENYYRFDSEANAEQTPRTTDSLLFRAGGSAIPANAGNGFLFDAMSLSSSTVVPDTTAPVITLVGDSSVTVSYGSVYTDAGATASDDVDEIVIPVLSGSVNTSMTGVYTLTYTATDAAGNISTATRTVTVSPQSSGGGGGSAGSNNGAVILFPVSPSSTPTPSVLVSPTPTVNPRPRVISPRVVSVSVTPTPTSSTSVSPTPSENQNNLSATISDGNMFARFWQWLTGLFR